jgi:Tol biopolymer transport system component
LAPAFYTDPAWSPDGTEFAVVKDANRLLIVDASSLSIRVIQSVPAPGQLSNPSWSPDGKEIAFSKGAFIPPPAPGPPHLVIIQLATGTTRDLGPAFGASWSPDGKWIAITDLRGYVDIVSPVTGARRSLDVKGAGTSWAPDGSELAYGDSVRHQYGISVVSLKGGRPNRVHAPGQVPAWSPNGAEIAYLAGDPLFDLMVAHADGSGARSFTDVHVGSFSWSPDGRTMLVAEALGVIHVPSPSQ